MGETDREHSERLLGEIGLCSTLEDERLRLFFFLEILLCSLLSFLSLDLPDFLDLERFRGLILESPTAEEDLILSPVGSKAECHELVSSEPKRPSEIPWLRAKLGHPSISVVKEPNLDSKRPE